MTLERGVSPKERDAGLSGQTLILRRLRVERFRNLHIPDKRFDSGFNLVLGPNGEGKTNLLEAVAVLGNLRSFRRAPPRRLVRFNERDFRLHGVVEGPCGIVRLTHTLSLGPPVQRSLRVNGAKVKIAEYLQQLPVFSLSARDSELVIGAPEARRALVDRLVFFSEPRHLEVLREYAACLRQRNAALLAGASSGELSAWEERLARSAVDVVVRRQRSLIEWKGFFQRIYEAIRPPGFPELAVSYRSDSETTDYTELAEFYRQRYHDQRARDRKLGYTVDGPHRHDLQLRAGGRTARDVLSAGQVKTVAAALCFSTLALVEERRKERLPVLVDDVDAEIDDDVLARLLAFLGRRRQMFVSSAHVKSLVRVAPRAARWFMTQGSIRGDPEPSEVAHE